VGLTIVLCGRLVGVEGSELDRPAGTFPRGQQPCHTVRSRDQPHTRSLTHPRIGLGASTTPCARADMDETTRLATTIETWWPAIAVPFIEQVTNARTERFNRIITQVKRVGCGFRNMDNYQRRIMAHIAVTRPQRLAAWRDRPAQMRRAPNPGGP
jgi:Transposase